MGAALLIAVSLEHLVRLLVRRGVGRERRRSPSSSWAWPACSSGFGFTLIPPAIAQGKQLVKDVARVRAQRARAARSSRGSISASTSPSSSIAPRSELPNLLEGAASPVLAGAGRRAHGRRAPPSRSPSSSSSCSIFGGRLVETALREARADRRAVYEEVVHKIYHVDRRLPGRPHAHLPVQRRPHDDLPRDRRRALLPAARHPRGRCRAWCRTRGRSSSGTFISIIALVTQGHLARRRGGDLLRRLRPDRGQHPRPAHLPAHRPRQPARRDAVDSLPGRARRGHGRDRRRAHRRDAADHPARAPAHPARAAAARRASRARLSVVARLRLARRGSTRTGFGRRRDERAAQRSREGEPEQHRRRERRATRR